jgi:hypothetical protein
MSRFRKSFVSNPRSRVSRSPLLVGKAQRLFAAFAHESSIARATHLKMLSLETRHLRHAHFAPLGWEHIAFNSDYVWPAEPLATAFRPLRNPHAESRIQLYCANQLDPPAKDPRLSRPVRKQPAAAAPPRREKDNEPADSF